MATKKCPFCAEEIQVEPIKCHFCAENIELLIKQNNITFFKKISLKWKNSLIALYFKRRRLEEQQRIEALHAKDKQKEDDKN